jgi:hypothetical protein
MGWLCRVYPLVSAGVFLLAACGIDKGSRRHALITGAAKKHLASLDPNFSGLVRKATPCSFEGSDDQHLAPRRDLNGTIR